MKQPVQLIKPGTFEPERHWYAKALNATIHPMVAFFLNLDKHRIIERYCHLHPTVKRDYLHDVLSFRPRYFRWAGADLINVVTEKGTRNMVVIENNSCPSGQKSMPLLDDHEEMGGYKRLIEDTFLPTLKGQRVIKEGVLAVLYDKNPVEASGYAEAIAEILQEDVYYIYFPKTEYQEYLRWDDGVLQFRDEKDNWVNIRAAFRYVTQKPWNRIPVQSKTKILNPILACLAGGRNKMIAAKAYEIYNAEIGGSGLHINIPETIWDVSKNEIPIWVKKMGGQAVIKIPYSNAGQGVFTIVNEGELDAFMDQDFEYDQFIVQSLIGNYNWSSTGSKGKLFHVGMIPNKKGETFVADVRMMVQATAEGIRPIAIYARRAASPLVDQISDGTGSWGMLGTNLSIKVAENVWESDTNRLVLMDRRDFNRLGIGVDDMIEAFIQTVLSMTAIDRMASTLINSKGRFRKKLFKSLNDDPAFMNEIMFE